MDEGVSGVFMNRRRQAIGGGSEEMEEGVEFGHQGQDLFLA